jgi:Matrixin
MDGHCRRTLLAVAAALLTTASTAHAATSPAQRWPVDGPAFQAARQIAVEHWGMNPCQGDVSISWGKLPADENAVSSWTNQFQDYGDPEHNTLCDVTFNTKQDWDWPKLCTVFAHEFGHLAGNAHSADPDDVMFAYYVGNELPECAAVSPAESQAPTAPRPSRQTPAKKRASRSKAYRGGTTRRPKRTGSRSRQR